jgi:hypothetical protein
MNRALTSEVNKVKSSVPYRPIVEDIAAFCGSVLAPLKKAIL